jgi:hypothetical protein
VAKVPFAAEVLPVRVLAPALDQVLIVEHVHGLRYSSEAINRVGNAGHPEVEADCGLH